MNGSVPASYAPAGEAIPPPSSFSEKGSVFGYASLFAPFAAAWLATGVPSLSYMIAWAGSFWILFLTLSGRVKPLPTDRSLFDQLLRPIVLTQLIFAGYNFISSIFYFMDINGFYYLSRDPFASAPVELVALTAEAQRYYVLAHAGVATGMLAAMDYRRSGEWAVRPMDNPVAFLLVISAVSFGAAELLGGGLAQIAARLSQLSLVSSILALALAVPTGSFGLLVIAGAVYAVNLGAAFLTGFKEHVIVAVLLLGVFAYPYARKTVIVGAPIILIFLLAILPTYANVFRSLNWVGTASDEEAATVALDAIRSGEQDIAQNNWTFLTGRISEISLFLQYLVSIDQTGRYYKIQLLDQTIQSLIPRVFWPDKPMTENVVMERVYENGIVSRNADVSAKPQYVVDGYLSYGWAGLLIASIVFGLLASLASRTSERFFGGYFWGSGLVYTSFFATFWKGNSFEFFFNTVMWSFVLLIPLFLIGRMTGWLISRDAVVEDEVDVEEARGGVGGWAPTG